MHILNQYYFKDRNVSGIKPFFICLVFVFLTFTAKFHQLFKNFTKLETKNKLKEPLSPPQHCDSYKAYMLTFNCVKSARIRYYFGPHFPAFGLNTERYSESLRIQSECEKMRTRMTPNMDIFYAVIFKILFHSLLRSVILLLIFKQELNRKK